MRSGTPVGTRATTRALNGGARGTGFWWLLARYGCQAVARRVLGGFWRVMLVQAFARWMSRLIRNSGRLAGTGVIEAVRVSRTARRGASRMIRAKPDQKRRAQDQSGASCRNGAGAVRVSCATALVRSVRLGAANDTSAQPRAAH